MRLKLFVSVAIFVTASNAAFAQKGDAENQAPKPTIEDAQKLVDTIRGDKTKLKAYCELGKLHEQIEKAEEKNDTKEMDALVAKLDSLEQQGGPITYGSWMGWEMSIQVLLKVRSSLLY